ncbi:MAG TPA: hypothetical protein VM266_16270 [Solirubrobacteraceae bacterium]|nr:hypothetical protein [Solirubrobacteraceae bacterium]
MAGVAAVHRPVRSTRRRDRDGGRRERGEGRDNTQAIEAPERERTEMEQCGSSYHELIWLLERKDAAKLAERVVNRT